jgi:hypothetical protein
MTIGYGQRGRSGMPREYFLNFGGWFAHPYEDQDVFARLPKWRQDEILEAARVSREHPEAVAFEIYDIATGRPYPGQVLMEAFMRASNQPTASAVRETVERPSINDPQLQRLVSVIPDSVPLASIRARAVDKSMDKISARDLTQDQALTILHELLAHVTPEKLIQSCTPHGKGGYIKHAKPTDGVYAYIWRMARLFNGDDPCMPVTADWDLSDGIEKLTGLRISFALRNDYAKQILSALEAYSDLLVLATGGNPLAGSLRWGRVMGWEETRKLDSVATKLGVSAEALSTILIRMKMVAQ